MKLVKNENKAETGSDQCREVTNNGSRCSRNASKRGYCMQHYRLRKEKGLMIDTLGAKPLEQIPAVPEALEIFGKKHFQIYCQFMIDQGRLYQIYEPVVQELCYLEEQLEVTKGKIKIHGDINFYDSGPQVSGYATRYKDILRDIRNLRKDLALTSATQIVRDKAADPGQTKQSYAEKKAKGWD